MATYIIEKSPLKTKKFRVTTPSGKKINFGAKGYEDYTIHHDPVRKERYIARHKPNEIWTKKGINTAGFWSLWLLWNKRTINASIKDIKARFGIKIKCLI